MANKMIHGKDESKGGRYTHKKKDRCVGYALMFGGGMHCLPMFCRHLTLLTWTISQIHYSKVNPNYNMKTSLGYQQVQVLVKEAKGVEGASFVGGV